MPCLMIVFRVLLLCLRLAREVDNSLLCCWVFFMWFLFVDSILMME